MIHQPSKQTITIIGVLIVMIMHFSCKKDLCENCTGNQPPVDNHPPVANVGNDQTIILSTDSVYLDADSSTDSNGVIVAFQWTKVSGPDSITIVNPTAVLWSISSKCKRSTNDIGE